MTGRSLALAVAAACAALVSAARAQDDVPKRRFLVTFKAETTKAERDATAREMGLAVTEDIAGLAMAVVESPGNVEALDTARILAHPQAEAVEEDVYRNWLLKDAATEAGSASSTRIPWGVARVDAPAAWPTADGSGVTVAVVDTGIDCAHPDLDCRLSSGVNIIEPGASARDDNDHGTHVSGTIAGRGLSGGPLGVAPKATLVPVKVLDRKGGGRVSDIVKGILWAADARVDVINMSLGGPLESAALERAVAKALDGGTVVVCAAGNAGPLPNSVGYPAGYPGVIAVAASDKKDRLAEFSSRGPAVGFIAPGVDILSTAPGGGLKIMSGTSMASPHVAGLAALAIQCGARGASGVRRAFAAAAARLPLLKSTEEGAGMIDAAGLCR